MSSKSACQASLDKVLKIIDDHNEKLELYIQELHFWTQFKANEKEKWIRTINPASNVISWNNGWYDCNKNTWGGCCREASGQHRKCRCQRDFSGRSHLKVKCGDGFFCSNKTTSSFCNTQNGGVSYKNNTLVDNLRLSDSMWPIKEPDIDAIKPSKPTLPPNITFICQDCTNELTIDDIENSTIQDINQIVNCIANIGEEQEIEEPIGENGEPAIIHSPEPEPEPEPSQNTSTTFFNSSNLKIAGIAVGSLTILMILFSILKPKKSSF